MAFDPDDDFDIDFGEVDFSKAKQLPFPAQGPYTFTITDYSLAAPTKAESKKKGFNVKLTMKFADPTEVVAVDSKTGDETGEEADFSSWTVKTVVWVDRENPFGAKNFFEAVLHTELDSSVSIKDPSDYIGEEVGAVLYHEPHYQDPERMTYKIRQNSFYAV